MPNDINEEIEKADLKTSKDQQIKPLKGRKTKITNESYLRRETRTNSRNHEAESSKTKRPNDLKVKFKKDDSKKQNLKRPI